jgi:phosphohistidine phosphatase
MKTLYLVRHAKSDSDNKNIADMDRPLNSRGYREASEMSLLLKNNNNLPDLLIASPAVRTYSTALIFSRNFGFNASKIMLQPNLYESAVKEYLKVIRAVDDKHNSIMLFGHNPTITNLSDTLTPSLIEHIPPGGVVGISDDCKTWKEFGSDACKLIFYHFPEK